MTYRLLLDTNILLDFMDPARPESDAAVEVFRRCIGGTCEGFICATSLKDLYYVGRKHLGEQAARDFYRAFLAAFAVLGIDDTVCRMALDSNEPDIEDAIVRVLAEENDIDFILTRDAEAFRASSVCSLSAATFLQLFPE